MKTDEIFLTLLHKNDLRLTKTRKVLIELFLRTQSPLSVPKILSVLRKMRMTVNKTTVYRELEQLQKVEIIIGVQLGDRKQYYELASREHHHHLVCLRCERVADIDVNESMFFVEEKKVKCEKQFTILRHSLEFFGLCKMCS